MDKTLLALVDFLYQYTDMDRMIANSQENPCNGREIIINWLNTQITASELREFKRALSQSLTKID